MVLIQGLDLRRISGVAADADFRQWDGPHLRSAIPTMRRKQVSDCRCHATMVFGAASSAPSIRPILGRQPLQQLGNDTETLRLVVFAGRNARDVLDGEPHRTSDAGLRMTHGPEPVEA